LIYYFYNLRSINYIIQTMENVCLICYESFDVKKKPIHCKGCPSEFCKECIQTHLISLEGEPSCPSCHYIWDKDFCEDNLTKKFMRGAYKKTRMELLYKSEEKKLKKTMKDVENIIKSEEYTDIISAEAEEIRKMQEELNSKKNKLRDMRETQRNLRLPNYISETEFKTKCPNADCNGFLNEDFTCILCSTSFCNKCLEKITKTVHGGESKTNNHVCDPEKLATYEMIKKECKPCPGCAEPISKINGCDQMWCTKCHVAFSWDTGKIDYGRIHNPHFIEWEKQNGGSVLRQPGEILCGGLPELHNTRFLSERACLTHRLCKREHLTNYDKIPGNNLNNQNVSRYSNFPIFKSTINQKRFFRWLSDVISNVEMFKAYCLDDYRAICHRRDITRETRIKFLRKQIDEKKFKAQIYRIHQKKAKDLDLLHIFELCYVVCVEQINEIFSIIVKLEEDIFCWYATEYYKAMMEEHGEQTTFNMYVNYRRNIHIMKVPKIVNCIESIENILAYSRKQLIKVGLKYGTSVPIINSSFSNEKHTLKYKYSIDKSFIEDKLHVLQRTNRIKTNNYGGYNGLDTIPIKELFYDETFDKKISLRRDGTWYFRKNALDDDPAVIQYDIQYEQGIRV